jgi:hypothetical protein
MERFQDIWVIDTLPEELAARMKTFLKSEPALSPEPSRIGTPLL